MSTKRDLHTNHTPPAALITWLESPQLTDTMTSPHWTASGPELLLSAVHDIDPLFGG
jgi:hypothetical protein